MHDRHCDRADDEAQDRRGGGIGQPGADTARGAERIADVLFEVMNRVVEHGDAELVEADQEDVAPDPEHRGDPDFESTDRTTGMARTSPRPNEAAGPSRFCASRT